VPRVLSVGDMKKLIAAFRNFANTPKKRFGITHPPSFPALVVFPCVGKDITMSSPHSRFLSICEEFRFHKEWPCTSQVSWDPSASFVQVPHNPNDTNVMKAEGKCCTDGSRFSIPFLHRKQSSLFLKLTTFLCLVLMLRIYGRLPPPQKKINSKHEEFWL